MDLRRILTLKPALRDGHQLRKDLHPAPDSLNQQELVGPTANCQSVGKIKMLLPKLQTANMAEVPL